MHFSVGVTDWKSAGDGCPFQFSNLYMLAMLSATNPHPSPSIRDTPPLTLQLGAPLDLAASFYSSERVGLVPSEEAGDHFYELYCAFRMAIACPLSTNDPYQFAALRNENTFFVVNERDLLLTMRRAMLHEWVTSF